MKRGISAGGNFLDNDPTRKPIPARAKRKAKRKAQNASRKKNRK